MNNTPVLKICYLLSIPYACQIIMLDSIRSLFRTQLETCNRRPDLKTSSESPQSTSMGRYFRTFLRHQIRTSSDSKSGHPRYGQIGCLEGVVGTLDRDVLEMSWGPIFAGWDI